MKKEERNALIALPIIILISVGIALAGSQVGRWSWNGVCLGKRMDFSGCELFRDHVAGTWLHRREALLWFHHF